MTIEEIFDTFHKEGIELYGKDWLFVNDRIIAICQANHIDWRDKTKVIPFLQLVNQLKKDNV